MNVLSLFDGMSCGRIALDRSGIKVDKYYASEIDKYAIKVSDSNYPDIVRLGDVTKWKEWDIDWSSIDLVTGGFPCQAWSVAGKQLGDKDERGMLFWTMLDVMKEVRKHNPKANFLIENVKMKKEFEQYITYHTEQALGGVNKILINSALVSAQNRNRYYWTSWEVDQPEDRGVVLSDILECDFVDRDKSHCLDANYSKGGNLKSYFEKNRRQLVFKCASIVGRKINPLTGNRDDNNPDIKYIQRLEMRGDDETNCLTTVHKDNYVVLREKAKAVRSSGRNSRDRHEWDSISDCHYRKLTPIECERLQGLDDNYTEGVSNTQRYKMLGNGWQVDTIVHIFNYMPKP